MPNDVITISQTVFGLIIGVASGAFTAGVTWMTLQFRLSRNEQQLEELKGDFEKFQMDYKEAKKETDMVRIRTESSMASLQTDIKNIAETQKLILDFFSKGFGNHS